MGQKFVKTYYSCKSHLKFLKTRVFSLKDSQKRTAFDHLKVCELNVNGVRSFIFTLESIWVLDINEMEGGAPLPGTHKR